MSKFKDKYAIIEVPELHPTEIKGDVHGPFNSIEAAKKWIIEDAKESYDEAKVGTDEDWGSLMLICKVVSALRPVPTVSVKWELRDEEGGEQ